MARFLPLLLVFVFAACGSSETTIVPPSTEHVATVPAGDGQAGTTEIESGDPLPLDPAVRVGTLDNGLTYYIQRNTEPQDRAELRLAVDAGSVLERPDQLGLAHFVEHMLFNGTERFEEQEIVDFMERIGMRFGPDVNAYTSFDETVYMLQIPTDDEEIMQTAFEILSDWSARATLSPEEIDLERGVVVEEWRARMQNAQGRIMEQMLPVLLHGSRYEERMPIGDPELIRTADYETIRDFYETWYRPELMAVIAVGDFDVDEIEARIRSEFGPIENPADATPRPEFDMPGHEETLYAVVTDPEYPITSVEIAFKTDREAIETTTDFRTRIVESLFNSILNKRLSEITREPAAPFSVARVYRGAFVRPGEFYGMNAQVEEDSVLAAVDRLLTEALRVARHGFTASELERQKVETLRSYQRAFEERASTHSGAFASRYVAHFLEESPAPGADFEYALAQDLMPQISLDELNRLADDLLDSRNRVVLVTMPEREDVTPPTEDQLARVMADAQLRDIAAYEDDVSDLPLLASIPNAALVVDEQTIDDIDTHVFTLENGVRVVFKPTNFKQDEVLLTAFSPGGHSLVNDENYFDAANAAAIVGRSGVGAFNYDQLQRQLSGQVASVTPYIGELDEGFRGAASPEDLEVLFQLIHLYFTAPRADSSALTAYQNQQKPFLRNRSATPIGVFQDSLNAALYGDDIRRQVPTVEMVDALDLQNAYDIYRERFSDAGDFTFVFVGNAEPETIRSLARTYLGTLPATSRDESWQNVRTPLPQDVVTTTVRKGIGDQSQTLLLFHGPFDYGWKERHVLSSLADVLSIRLREDLREERSAVYGVGVNANSTDRPVPEYGFTINFTSDPGRVEELVDAVFDQIERVQTEGPTADELEKVKEQQRRARETQLRTNAFWTGTLSYYFDRGADPTQALRYLELVENLTAEDIQQAANEYLNEERYVRAVLYPEAESSP